MTELTYSNPFEGFTEPLPAQLAGFSHEFARLGDVTVSFVRGPANGRKPLVLLPAQMGTWRTYSPVLPALAADFEVFALELRGHGSSTWTPGDYSWDSVGTDISEFLRTVVGGPAVLSGNSSGGILALWCASRVPERVSAIVLEDAPVFSVEMPRFRDRDRFVYTGLEHIATALGDPRNRNLADYFRGLSLPVSERRTKRIPEWFVGIIERGIARHARRNPGKPAGLDAWWLPSSLGEIFRSLSMFDPDFARAFVDGRMYGDFSHESALKATTCPVLLLHGDWKRYADHGLVGALDDDDVARVRELAPQTQYVKIPANHVIHRYRPREFVAAVTNFAAAL